MSGGEKSFSTICLLLSLWDAMGCPIRGEFNSRMIPGLYSYYVALDEFDVYMDAVNRYVLVWASRSVV